MSVPRLHVQAKEKAEYSLWFKSRSITKLSVKLTVTFAATHANDKLTSLSSLKVIQALEKICPESVVEIRFNRRLDVIAVDARNGQTTLEQLRCTDLCGIPVKVYEPLPRPRIFGLIRNVDSAISDDDIAQHLGSPEQRVSMNRRRGHH